MKHDKTKRNFTLIVALALLALAAILLIMLVWKTGQTYNIYIDRSDGSDVVAWQVAADGEVVLPELTDRSGYVFAGWLTPDGVLSSGGRIEADVVLKAIWLDEHAETANLVFLSEGGSEVDVMVVTKGPLEYLPVPPTKEGYEFAGWVDINGEKIEKGVDVEDNMTLIARWNKV